MMWFYFILTFCVDSDKNFDLFNGLTHILRKESAIKKGFKDQTLKKKFSNNIVRAIYKQQQKNRKIRRKI
jgi:hypothetical protein